MSVPIIFVPKFDLDAKANLSDFIDFSNHLLPLNSRMDKNSNYWSGVVNFTKVGVHSKSRDESDLLDEEIRAFAKSYILYSKTIQSTKAIHEIKAIRAIEAAMLSLDLKPSILNVDTRVLNQAVKVLETKYARMAGYHGGCHLAKLYDFLIEKKIIRDKIWINPIKKPEELLEKVGREAREARIKKLPDESALLALAEIFALGPDALSQRDIFTTSSVALLMAAPARGSEIFYLKKDCLYEDVDRHGNPCIGIRWFGGKGFGHDSEWVPGVMVPVVRDAIDRLTKLSNDARVYADSISANKRSVFVNYKRNPEVDVRWVDALYCMFSHQLNKQNKVDKTRLWMPTIGTLNEDLAPSKKVRNGKPQQQSIFERHGYPTDLGIKSHQPRHLLTSLAKVNGMDSELLSKWAKRADSKHNRVYNHVDPSQYKKQIRQVKTARVPIPSAEMTYEVVSPESIFELNTGGIQTYHQTDFGMCDQNLMTHPCPRHRVCIGCGAHQCKKGDEECVVRILDYRSRETTILEREKLIIDRGVYGADTHHQLRIKQIAFCDKLLELHNDDSIPDGSVLKLSASDELSSLDKALLKNSRKILPKIEKTAPPRRKVNNGGFYG